MAVMESHLTEHARHLLDGLFAAPDDQSPYPPKTSHLTLLAGIMGLGCGISVRKMARISLASQKANSRMPSIGASLENIRSANDDVLKAMDTMELPNLYRRETDKLHTASDGQKFEVRSESLNASRSFKYFGQGQGVSAYTFVDERNFFFGTRS